MKQEMTNERWSRVVANLMSDIEMYEYDIAIRDKELERLKIEYDSLKEKIKKLERGDKDE